MKCYRITHLTIGVVCHSSRLSSTNFSPAMLPPLISFLRSLPPPPARPREAAEKLSFFFLLRRAGGAVGMRGRARARLERRAGAGGAAVAALELHRQCRCVGRKEGRKEGRE